MIHGSCFLQLFIGNVGAMKGKVKVSQMVRNIENSLKTNNQLTFANKVIIITGASSGIGAHAALHLAKLGAKMSIVGRNKEQLNVVSEQIKSVGAATPLVIVADVAKDARRIIDETVNQFGKLNILINNAGVSKLNDAANVDMNDYDLIMDVNVRSVVELIKYAIPHLKKTKGNILNVSSICAVRSPPYHYVYSASKAAVNQLTKCAARDLGPSGIRVNALSPGIIQTP